jgi:hypothetical protein
MITPEILYHGTTMLRWYMIQKDGLLRCNMPKSFQAEELFGSGYVYLTSDIEGAIMYGYSKSIMDIASGHLEKQMKLNPNNRDPVVLGMKAIQLRDNLEINDGISTSLFKQIPIKTNENTQLYKYKGNIKSKILFAHRYVPFTAFDNNHMNQMRKHHEKKLHASQSIMNRVASEPIIRQLSFVKIPKIFYKHSVLALLA